MRLWAVIAFVLCAADAAVLGSLWGAVTLAGCLLLVAFMVWILARRFTVVRTPPLRRRPVTVRAVVLDPPETPAAITEGKRQ